MGQEGRCDAGSHGAGTHDGNGPHVVCGGSALDPPGPAFGEEQVPERRRRLAGPKGLECRPFGTQRLGERKGDGASHGRGGLTRRIPRPTRAESRVRCCREGCLVIGKRRLPAQGSLGLLQGEVGSKSPEIPLRDRVDQAGREGVRRSHGPAIEDEAQRARGIDEPRQAHGSTCPGDQAEGHLGEAHDRVSRRHAGVAGQGHLVAAAQRRAVDGRHDRFRTGIDRRDHAWQGGLGRRRAELADIGALP